jgi:hypothetical protein
MSILGGSTAVTGRLTRATNNALTVSLQTEAGADVGKARQRGSAGVLFGFKNGGRGSYKLVAGEDVLEIAVGPTTTVSRADAVIGRIAPQDGGARFEDAAGRVLALWRPYHGMKADDAWRHPITSPDGTELGTLSLVRTKLGWKNFDGFLTTLATWDMAGISQKLPSAGSLLALNAPLDSTLGDLLAAACVDVAVFPKGYIVTNSAA